MDHLIELRSRLIKALLGFGVAFIICFFFAKQIYNVLVWPFVWIAGPENSKFIYTALLEYFITQLKLALFGAGFISFPIVATQIYKFVAPGLYRHERNAFLPYLIATPVFFVMGAALVYFVVLPMLVRFSLGMPDDVKGIRITRQGKRNQGFLKIDRRHDGRGNPYFWIGFERAAMMDTPAEGTDLAALAARHVSVTPLRLDRTDEAFSETLLDTLK